MVQPEGCYGLGRDVFLYFISFEAVFHVLLRKTTCVVKRRGLGIMLHVALEILKPRLQRRSRTSGSKCRAHERLLVGPAN